MQKPEANQLLDSKQLLMLFLTEQKSLIERYWLYVNNGDSLSTVDLLNLLELLCLTTTQLAGLVISETTLDAGVESVS
jgi:hypothetical protein